MMVNFRENDTLNGNMAMKLWLIILKTSLLSDRYHFRYIIMTMTIVIVTIIHCSLTKYQ